jgi:hypothetical protein
VVTPTENSCQASLGPQRPERGAPQVTAGLRGGQGPHGLNIPKTQPFRLSVVLCFQTLFPNPTPILSVSLCLSSKPAVLSSALPLPTAR